jgi:glycosyltransferase involved in cell wall biosynthesis
MKILLLVYGQEAIMTALQQGFQKAGAETFILPILENTSCKTVKDTIHKFQPQVIFTHNSYVIDIRVTEGLEIENTIQQSGIPFVSWFWDSPWASGSYSMVRRFCERIPPPFDLAIGVDDENVLRLKKLGMKALVLPIGVDLNRFKRIDLPLPPSLAVPSISFVGKANTQVEGPNLSRESLLLNHCKSIYEDFHGLARQTRMGSEANIEVFRKDLVHIRDLLIEFFHTQCWTRSEFEVHTHRFLNDAEELLDPVSFREVSIYFGRIEFLYSWWMLNDLLFTLRAKDIRVFGGDEWAQKYLGDYPFSSPRLTETELCHLFSLSPINLCHTKWQFRTAAHERPFLISACGGFTITDERKGLRECFSDDEIPTYENREDLFEKIDFYLAHPDERSRMAHRAYHRVVKDHGYDRRAEELLVIFEKLIRGTLTI